MLLATRLPAGDPSKHASETAVLATTTSKPATRTAEQKKQDDIDRVMEFFRVTQPDVYDQANGLRNSDPAKFDKLILNALPNVNHLEIMRQNKPALFALSMEDLKLGYLSLRLAHDLKRADLSESDRIRITHELELTVAAEFNVQQKIRQYEIDDLEAKVRKLNDQVKARESDKSAIIQKRTDDLTKGTPRLDW
jgi:hypothetical protein